MGRSSVLTICVVLSGVLGTVTWGCVPHDYENMPPCFGCGQPCRGNECRSPQNPHGAYGGSGGGGGYEESDAQPEEEVDGFVEPPCDPSMAVCSCETDDVCGDGQQCLGGACLIPCEYTSECGASRICVDGQCVDGCDGSASCEDGYICSDKGVCLVDPEKSECGGELWCESGRVCAGGICQDECVSNVDCGASEVCNVLTGGCMVDPQPTRPCAIDPGVCNSNQVCSKGFCRYACSGDMSCKLIDARIPVCSGGICMSEVEANPQCTRQQDCELGQSCVSNVCM
ncbi:MAG: hypothetical protein FWD57_00905 [Polyangiaceae bacterium]|nr:hypothetical protein [Polyangiaceae bacterium]